MSLFKKTNKRLKTSSLIIGWRQQKVILDCAQASVMPNIDHPRAVSKVKIATLLCGTINITYKVTGWSQQGLISNNGKVY